MLDLDAFNKVFDEHYTRTAFRLEVLDAYAVASDGGDVARYLAGEPDPDPDRKGPFLQTLRAERAAGKRQSRVRVLRRPLTPYLRYECEWGYVPNVAAGEQIRVLDLTDTDWPGERVDDEFWLLDNEVALLMRYNDAGEFVGAELADDVDRYRRARQRTWDAAVDFTAWWARHPEEHRDHWMSTANR